MATTTMQFDEHELDLIHDALTILAENCDNEVSHERAADTPDSAWIALHVRKAEECRRLVADIEDAR